jgi:Proteobacterial lipase chaperone protein
MLIAMKSEIEVSSKLWIAGAAAAGALLVGVLSLTKQPVMDQGAGQAVVSAATSSAEFPNVSQPDQQDANMGLLPQRPLGKMPSALDAMVPPSFQVAHGRLVVNPHARTEIERVTAVYSRDEAMAKLGEVLKDMPPQAQREVRDLYEQYTQYNQALNQAIPLEQKEISTLEQAQSQFEAMKKLRAQFFGANAEAMFKDDELLTQRILDFSAEYMKTHPNASLQEATGYGQEKVLSAPQDIKP